jgi:hypothetical protein
VRDDAVDHALADVPLRCPDVQPPPPDAGPPAADAAVEPPVPDLSAVPSAAHDLSGQWLLTARLPIGLPLRLWLSLAYAAGADGASLDGALRSTKAMPGDPALVHFDTRVDADGRFVIWLPGASLDLGTARLDGDILLAGATLGDDAFCGQAAGAVRSPLKLDLAGTTFSAQRWTPGTPVPEDAPNACP